MLGKYKNTLIASAGAGAEYYDFIVYALMSPYLSQIFFHNHEHTYSIIHYFSIFAVGYFFRPIGGVLLGYVSDRYNRKRAFILSTFLMCISTFIIGLLPVKHMNPTLLVIGLVICRIVQGLSFGGQLSNSVTFVYENSKAKYLHGSFIFTSVGLGSTLALFVVHVLNSYVTYQEILDGWWRAPFIFGGILMLICLVFRGHLREVEEPLASNVAFFNVIRKILAHKNEVILSIWISTAIASLIIFNLFLPTYFSVFYSYDVSRIFTLMMYAMIFSVIVSPVFGVVLSKKSDKILFFIYGIVVFLCFLIFFMCFLRDNDYISVFVFMCILQAFIGYFFVLSLPFMSSLFDASIRNTAVAFCYNIGYVIASIVPSLVTYFKGSFGEYGIFYVIGIIYFTLNFLIILMFKLKKKLYYDRSKNYS